MYRSLSDFWPLSSRSVGGLFLLIAGMAVAAGIPYYFGELNVPIVGSSILLVFLLVLSLIDLQVRLLPNWLTLPLIALGILHAWAFGGPLWLSVAGGLTGYLSIFVLSEFWLKYRQKAGIGLGDAKLLAASGTWVGIFALPVVLLIASSAALIAVCVYFVADRTGNLKEMTIPFGPYLSFATWAVWCNNFV